jgi:hypothetical protein
VYFAYSLLEGPSGVTRSPAAAHSSWRTHPPHFGDVVLASGSCLDSHTWKIAQNAHNATTESSGKK